jgi:hypothetical protein
VSPLESLLTSTQAQHVLPGLSPVADARTLPIGTAYAVWVGIGAVGTAILGIVLFQEPRDVPRLESIGLIIAGVSSSSKREAWAIPLLSYAGINVRPDLNAIYYNVAAAASRPLTRTVHSMLTGDDARVSLSQDDGPWVCHQGFEALLT